MTVTGPADEQALRAWALTHARSVGRGGPDLEQSAPGFGKASPELTPGVAELEGLFDKSYQQGLHGGVTCMDIAAVPGGPLLVAGGTPTGRVRVWDGQTGRLLRVMQDGSEPVRSVTWNTTGGRALLAVRQASGCAIWDGATAALLFRLPGPQASDPVRVHGADRFLIRGLVYGPGGWYGNVPGSSELGEVLCGCVESTGAVSVMWADKGALRMVSQPTNRGFRDRPARPESLVAPVLSPSALSATTLSNGQFLLASGSGGGISVYEVTYPQAHLVVGYRVPGVRTLAWFDLPDRRHLLVAVCDTGEVAFIELDGPGDAAAGTPGRWLSTRIFTRTYEHPGIVCATWCLSASGVPMSAVVCEDYGVRRAVEPFAPVRQAAGDDVPPVPSARGALIRLTDTFVPSETTPPPDTPLAPAAAPAPVPLPQVDPAALLALGKADLWPPLSLVEDLVALTGRAAPGTLHDRRFLALASHPGVVRLRGLGWPGRSRVGFAGLLASATDQLADCVPPPATGASERVAALREALAFGPSESEVPPVPPASVAAAADTVTDCTISLLSVLGPEAVQADPALPLLLAHAAADMPHLAPHQLLLLAPRAGGGSARTRTTAHAPGTSGTSNRGALTHLLPTQLALPGPVLLMKYSRHELLFRLHVTEAEPLPGEVTLVLDTSPPTFGPVEGVLRAAAHLVTLEFWRYGRHPHLVTFDRPSQAVPLARPTDILALWTTRTLDVPDVARALETAAATGAPALLLTQHRLPRELGLEPGPGLRLLTTHSADDAPAGRWARQFQQHVPPSPHPGELRNAISALLRT
ncbi:hypothetical protein ACH4SP_28200 [Streptomyces sp. NPDC021093]|uniref:hypothetical protein n=1 Tax=Streptomyces sp. NPDC021093 TaxID=3365112 RepID=UPI00379FB60D